VWAAAAGIALCSGFFVVFGSLTQFIRAWGLKITCRDVRRRRGGADVRHPMRGFMHLGIVLVLLGVALNQGFERSSGESRLNLGDEIDVGDYTVELWGIDLGFGEDELELEEGGDAFQEASKDQNHSAFQTEDRRLLEKVTARIRVTDEGGSMSDIDAKFRWHEGDGKYVSEPVIVTFLGRDVYVMLLEVYLNGGGIIGRGDPGLALSPDTAATSARMLIDLKPGVPLLWAGLVITLTGSGMLLAEPAMRKPSRKGSPEGSI
jgi:hypothetical protein